MKNLDDIVFEHRNKAYGCYHIRTTFPRRLRMSFLLVLLSFLFVTVTVYFWKINPLIEREHKLNDLSLENVEYAPEMTTLINQLSVPPHKEILSDKPESVEEESSAPAKRMVFQVVLPIKESKPIPPVADTSKTALIDKLLQRHIEDLKKENAWTMDTLSMILEQAPMFPGGYAAIQSYFFKNQHYPETALARSIQGSPVVSYIVTKDGLITNPKVVHGVDSDLDREAIRLVKNMPAWQPAICKGKPIACMLVLPVDFKIR